MLVSKVDKQFEHVAKLIDEEFEKAEANLKKYPDVIQPIYNRPSEDEKLKLAGRL